jgi:hypothetical protein
MTIYFENGRQKALNAIDRDAEAIEKRMALERNIHGSGRKTVAESQRERDEAQRKLFFDRPKKSPPEWTTVKGVKCLRCGNSDFVGCPVNGRESSAKFDMINIKTGQFLCQVNKNEVNHWLEAKC